jgi:hypothetical protein
MDQPGKSDQPSRAGLRLRDRIGAVDLIGEEDAARQMGIIIEEEVGSLVAVVRAQHESEFASLREEFDSRPAKRNGSPNLRQRIVLILGVSVLILCGIYQPYEAELRIQGDNLKAFLGYYTIFYPPTSQDAAAPFMELADRRGEIRNQAVQGRSWAYPSTIRILIPAAMVVLCTITLVLTVGDRPFRSRNAETTRDAS